MAKGHRSQIKAERNAIVDSRPSAKLSYARVSVQKACSSSLIEKLIRSAMANAENNNGMDINNLYVEEGYANKGPTMKRIQPRAQGRAYRIEKRTSHITVVLNER